MSHDAEEFTLEWELDVPCLANFEVFPTLEREIEFRVVVETLKQQIKNLRSSSGQSGNWHNTVIGWNWLCLWVVVVGGERGEGLAVGSSYHLCGTWAQLWKRGLNQSGLCFSDIFHRCPLDVGKYKCVFIYRNARRHWAGPSQQHYPGHSFERRWIKCLNFYFLWMWKPPNEPGIGGIGGIIPLKPTPLHWLGMYDVY